VGHRKEILPVGEEHDSVQINAEHQPEWLAEEGQTDVKEGGGGNLSKKRRVYTSARRPREEQKGDASLWIEGSFTPTPSPCNARREETEDREKVPIPGRKSVAKNQIFVLEKEGSTQRGVQNKAKKFPSFAKEKKRRPGKKKT